MPEFVSAGDIIPNENNPRKNFDQEKLEELAQSIDEHGILQPLGVKYAGIGEDGRMKYKLIYGERRLRAAKMIGLDTVPVVFREIEGDEESTAAAEALKMLVENLQREDLDPIEEAVAYHRVLGEFDMTQEELADQVGKSQGHIANRIRLLDLPETVRENISRGIISASHGKVLAGYKNLPTPMMEKAVEVIAADNVPVAKADNLVLRMVANNGMPLFDNHRKKPEFKTGKGSECYTCEHRAVGKDMYISGDNEQPFCLNPKCWEKKQEEAIQAAMEASGENNLVDISKLSYTQYEHWIKGTDGYDQSECRDCEHLKKGKGSERLYCLDPACMKKKKTAKTKADNKQKNNTFQAELGQITEMVAGRIDQTALIIERDGKIDRPTLIYLAAQVLANVDHWHDRKINRYQYLKNKFGWDNDLLKSSAYNLLHHDWDTFHRLLETLDELQLLEVIMEWPAVARGLKGAEGWFLQQVPQVETEPVQVPEPISKPKQGTDPVHELVGRTIKTHYDTGGVVTNVAGPRDDGFYSITYKHHRDDKKCYLNIISLKDGVVLCEGIPLTILENAESEPGPQQEPDRLPEKRYRDKNGRIIFVSTGLGGSEFGTFWETEGGFSKHRVKTQAMPMTPSKKEAQRNLDAWAEKNGLQLVDGDGQCQPKTA